MGGSMTALNPLNPKSSSITSHQRKNQKRRHMKNGSVSSNIGGKNKVSTGKLSIPSPPQLPSPSIHVPGLPEVGQQQQPRRHSRLMSPNIMSSKSTLDDIDDLDERNDRRHLTNGTHSVSKLNTM